MVVIARSVMRQFKNPLPPAKHPALCCMQIRQALLSWYDVNHRVLPWRRNPHSKRVLADPAYVCPPAGLPLNEFIYYVWVCEVQPFLAPALPRQPSLQSLATQAHTCNHPGPFGLGHVSSLMRCSMQDSCRAAAAAQVRWHCLPVERAGPIRGSEVLGCAHYVMDCSVSLGRWLPLEIMRDLRRIVTQPCFICNQTFMSSFKSLMYLSISSTNQRNCGR